MKVLYLLKYFYMIFGFSFSLPNIIIGYDNAIHRKKKQCPDFCTQKSCCTQALMPCLIFELRKDEFITSAQKDCLQNFLKFNKFNVVELFKRYFKLNSQLNQRLCNFYSKSIPVSDFRRSSPRSLLSLDEFSDQCF